MKFLIVFVCLIPYSFSYGLSSFAGDFNAIIESVDNRDNLPRNWADWHCILRKKNKVERTVDVWFSIKKAIVKPYIEYQTHTWSNGKWIKMAIDQLSKMSVCDDEIKDNFYTPIFEGNVTWTKECVLTPGFMKMQKGKEVNINALIHKVVQKTFYGRFKVIATVFDNKKNQIGGVIVVVTIQKK